MANRFMANTIRRQCNYVPRIFHIDIVSENDFFPVKILKKEGFLILWFLYFFESFLDFFKSDKIE